MMFDRVLVYDRWAAAVCRDTWAVCVLSGILFLMCKWVTVKGALLPLSLWAETASKWKSPFGNFHPYCCLVTSVCPPLCGEGTGRADTDDHTRRACQLDPVTHLADITWGILGYFQQPQTQRILLHHYLFMNLSWLAGPLCKSEYKSRNMKVFRRTNIE